MSNSRSPRAVRSTTIGINGIALGIVAQRRSACGRPRRSPADGGAASPPVRGRLQAPQRRRRSATMPARADCRFPRAPLSVLEAEARCQRERLALYRARAYGNKPTSALRLRELERAAEAAEARLRHARAARQRRFGLGGRGGLRSRSSGVIWRTTSEPVLICSSICRSFSRRCSSCRSFGVVIASSAPCSQPTLRPGPAPAASSGQPRRRR
jgi:hypothetical protein